MREMFGSVPVGSNPSDYGGRQVVDSSRACGMDQEKLRASDGWSVVWKLCAALPDRRDNDDSVRGFRSEFAEGAGNQCRALYRLRGLRIQLPLAAVQRDLCGGNPNA